MKKEEEIKKNDNNNNKPTTTDGDKLDKLELSQRPNGKMIAEARANADISDWVYAQSRLVIRSKSGMIETKDAVEQVLNDPDIKGKLLAHIASHDYDFTKVESKSREGYSLSGCTDS